MTLIRAEPHEDHSEQRIFGCTKCNLLDTRIGRTIPLNPLRLHGSPRAVGTAQAENHQLSIHRWPRNRCYATVAFGQIPATGRRLVVLPKCWWVSSIAAGAVSRFVLVL